MASHFSIVDIKGIPGGRRDQVKAAVMAGAEHLPEGYEGWITPARRPPAYTLRVIGPRGFYREVRFTGLENTTEITERIRHSLPAEIAAASGAH